MPNPSKEIELRVGTIRYADTGSGEPLVFLHGLLVNGRLWEELVPRLEGTHRCIVPDLPIGSHSVAMNADADLSAPAVASLIAEMLERLELDRVTLVGNDSGGALTQLVATHHPERVGRLVLTNCDAFDNFPPKLFWYLLAAARVPGGLPALSQSLRIKPLRRSPIAYGVLTKKRLSDELLDSWIRPGLEDPGVLHDTRKFIRGISRSMTEQAARDLASFAGPALFAWAPEDRWFPVEHADRLAAAMPAARVVRIPDSKTFVPLDQPERLAEAITAFIADTEPAPAASPA